MRVRVRRSLVVPAAALAAALVLAACGEDDFKNEPRPAAPVELGALVNDREVRVSPHEVGAGLVSVTISNQSKDTATFTLTGPTDLASGPIAPGDTAAVKGVLEEGDYDVSAGDEAGARDTKLTVGPERASSQNDLLLP